MEGGCPITKGDRISEREKIQKRKSNSICNLHLALLQSLLKSWKTSLEQSLGKGVKKRRGLTRKWCTSASELGSKSSLEKGQEHFCPGSSLSTKQEPGRVLQLKRKIQWLQLPSKEPRLNSSRKILSPYDRARKVLSPNREEPERLLIRQKRSRKSTVHGNKGTPWQAMRTSVHSTGLRVLTRLSNFPSEVWEHKGPKKPAWISK